MDSTNTAYLLSLIPWFFRTQMGDVLCRKVYNQLRVRNVLLDPLDASVFCFRCFQLAVPTVTAKVRVKDAALFVECLQCRQTTRAEIRHPNSDRVQRVVGSTSLRDFLA